MNEDLHVTSHDSVTLSFPLYDHLHHQVGSTVTGVMNYGA